MSKWRLLDHDPETGLKHWFRYIEDSDSWQHKYEQDTAPILEANKAAQNSGKNGKVSDEWWHAATIPNIIIHKWLVEEGWNALDKHNKDRLFQKLDSSEYAYLRPSNFRIGKRSRHV